MNIKTILLTIGIMSVSASASAQKVFNIDLWPNGPKEKSVDREDTARVRVFLPAENKNTRRAVVICPGGGYSHLAIEHEGYDWATFFNQEGIAAIVLKYRMPHGKYEVPISDAEEAIKLVRERSAEWRINPDDVGIMGFSAGGHLASTIATHSVKDAKPNFQILFYPVISMNPEFTHRGSHDNLLGEKPRKKREIEFSNDMQVSRTTPRAWIALSFNYQRQQLLHRTLQARRSRLHPRLSYWRPRLGLPLLVRLPHRDAARTEGLAQEFLIQK